VRKDGLDGLCCLSDQRASFDGMDGLSSP